MHLPPAMQADKSTQFLSHQMVVPLTALKCAHCSFWPIHSVRLIDENGCIYRVSARNSRAAPPLWSAFKKENLEINFINKFDSILRCRPAMQPREEEIRMPRAKSQQKSICRTCCSSKICRLGCMLRTFYTIWQCSHFRNRINKTLILNFWK